MDSRTDEIIHAILKRGNDVMIRRKGDGYIVMEVSRIIRATTAEAEQEFEKDLHT